MDCSESLGTCCTERDLELVRADRGKLIEKLAEAEREAADARKREAEMLVKFEFTEQEYEKLRAKLDWSVSCHAELEEAVDKACAEQQHFARAHAAAREEHAAETASMKDHMRRLLDELYTT